MRGSALASRANSLRTPRGVLATLGAFENVSLCRVEHGKIGFAGGDVGQGHARYLLCVVKRCAGFGEIIGGFRLHKSRPSLRSSCMKPVRSR